MRDNSFGITLTYNMDKLDEEEKKAYEVYYGLGKNKSQVTLDLIRLFARDYNVGLEDSETFHWALLGAKKNLLKKESGKDTDYSESAGD